MTLDEIQELNGAELAHMADVSNPDATDSPGAAFLYEVRRQYIDARFDLHEGDADPEEIIDQLAMTDAGTTRGCVPHPTHTQWQIFTDLAVWQNDYYELGAVTWEDISDAAERALGEVVRYLVRALIAADNGRPGDDGTETKEDGA